MEQSERIYGRFWLPGPTDVRPEVLAAQAQPLIGHRVPAFDELMAHIQPLAKKLMRTERPVYVSTSSATGLMEGAVRNGARRRVLSLVNGAFSDRFYQVAKACGVQVDPLEVKWGEAHTPEMLDNALRRGIYDAVTVVHCETSTGVLNPVKELAEVTRASGDVVILCDTVSTVGGAEFYTDAWGMDFVFTASQKAIAIPPGLALGVAQNNILERAKSKPDRGIYFDFLDMEKFILKHQTPNTPAVSLLFALKAQLDFIEEEGLENRIARHTAMAERTWQWVDEMRGKGIDLDYFAAEGYRSPTVTALVPPAPWTGSSLYAAVKRKGYEISTGYGVLRDKTFRIGHMGDHTLDQLEELLAVLEETLAEKP